MSFNADKCHHLKITKKKSQLKTNYVLHGQNLQKVESAKYLGVEITKTLHWGKHIQTIAAKANKTTAFVCRNLKGCNTSVQTHCYKAMARPIMEYASIVWDPNQENLKSTLEMVQRRAARRILHDFRPTTSATAMVERLNLDPLQSRRTADKVCMMYKIMNNTVDVRPPANLIIPATRITRGQQNKLQLPYSRTDTYKHSFFPLSYKTMEYPSHKFSLSPVNRIIQILTEGLAGSSKLNILPHPNHYCFYPVFKQVLLCILMYRLSFISLK